SRDGFFTTFCISPYSRYLARWCARRGLTLGGDLASRTPQPWPMRLVFFFPTPTASDGLGGPGQSKTRQGSSNLRTVVVLLPHGGANTSPS
ncbi:hypothetical protein, partial [Streptomyces sp. NPDC047028]|uniref:hypothetical protein n=1 Tax=Streptomyces sp. NPDC047028 TaxID=3155793 RepID=UPI0034110DD9